MSLMNRLGNCHNYNQGDTKKVLCVCSAGLLRSPTAALILSQAPFNFNTRAAGLVKEFALIIVDEVLLEWCDEIVCMEQEQKEILEKRTKKPIVCLDIADSYKYRDDGLCWLVREKYTAYSKPTLDAVVTKVEELTSAANSHSNTQ